ncbi:hypothetical protein C2845_PM06G25800 [Panicum miliaceum]|uniref:Kinesin motor domain-containing protein n=1 Tax=Panicum miliaceum TaxID=4540 RepID=A0A3L6R4H2_PANMI|nr:hypothetical protein C2845_PM06G25800 [Panicum miliaceum]
MALVFVVVPLLVVVVHDVKNMLPSGEHDPSTVHPGGADWATHVIWRAGDPQRPASSALTTPEVEIENIAAAAEVERAVQCRWRQGKGTMLWLLPLAWSTTNARICSALVRSIIRAAIDGFNSTVFAYGQTSSGKTYTMSDCDADPGIIPLTVRDLFETASQLIREACVQGLREDIVESAEQTLQLLNLGEANRHFGQTNMNARSSWSRTIFRMVVESRTKNQMDSWDAIRVSILALLLEQPTDVRCQRLEQDCSSDRQALVMELDQLKKKNSYLLQELSRSKEEADRAIAEKHDLLKKLDMRCHRLKKDCSADRQLIEEECNLLREEASCLLLELSRSKENSGRLIAEK